MATLSAAGVGSGAPPPVPGRSRLILEEWETRTLLTDEQLAGLTDLQHACADPPLPTFSEADEEADKAFAQAQVARTISQNSGTERNDSGPIQNAQQFFLWYASVEESMERQQEDVYRAYLTEVASYRDTCDDLYNKGALS